MSTEEKDMPMEDPGEPAAPAGGQTFDPTVLTELRTALGDDEFVLDIVQTFLVETPSHIATLTAAAREGDAQMVAATAHRIKGSALTFGAPRLAYLCVALETSPNESRSLASSVAQEFDDLCNTMSNYTSDVVR